PVATTLIGSGANGYSGNPATGISAGFRNIDLLVGGSGADTLTGENVHSTWNLAATDTYNDGGASTLMFAGFEILQGGSMNDAFTLTALLAAPINIDGGAGTLDTLTINGTANDDGLSITGTAVTINGVTA